MIISGLELMSAMVNKGPDVCGDHKFAVLNEKGVPPIVTLTRSIG